MGRVRPHLTYANVMVTLLAFVVLGGVAVAATSLPKNSVGNKQLKKNSVSEGKIREGAVTGAKVKDSSLTGADVVASTLGSVPYAEKAGSATSATTANSATSAQSAVKAESATTAQSATTASDANELGGLPPSAYAPSGRFLFGTADPTSEPEKKVLFALPGGLQVATDGDNDKKFELTLLNSGGDTWSIIHPGLKEEGDEKELSPLGGSLTFAPSPELTAVIILKDRDAPSKAVVLQCGLTFVPLSLTCFATLSPALSP